MKAVLYIKSITARELLQQYPWLKAKLWGVEFWSKGYFASTVGKHGDEKMLKNYVRNQGVAKDYQPLHQSQLRLL
ncbi:Transposase [Piscirickettsia salmonis]|nr:Transposase [Piscirickettsia salmonis]QGP57851.1 Transposase [Piscirickettsia salmonis]QGP65846.1 Transposase [Piscirickettsia salmonis]